MVPFVRCVQKRQSRRHRRWVSDWRAGEGLTSMWAGFLEDGDESVL